MKTNTNYAPLPNPRATRSASPWQRSSSILPAINMLPVRADPTQKPSIGRLRRPVERWLPLGNASVSARIVVLQHGGHQRPVIHRGSKHSRFRFVSTKTNTTQLGEGKGEEALALYNEIATDVTDYECHPYQFEFQRPAGLTRYRPDCARVFRDGSSMFRRFIPAAPCSSAVTRRGWPSALLQVVPRSCGANCAIASRRPICFRATPLSSACLAGARCRPIWIYGSRQ